MLRRLLSIVICVFLGVSSIYSQCIPNTGITNSGITPDSATGLTIGTVGQMYTQVLQIKVPLDSVATVPGFPFPVTIHIVSIQLSSFTGLPPGLTYSCSPTSCIFPGGSNGCVLISGTPTTSGTFNLNAILTTNYTVFTVPNSRADTVDYYHITINNSNVGLNQLSINPKFSLEQNSPNPISDVAIINYSIPTKGTVEFKLFNILGKEIGHEKIMSDAGQNKFSFDGRDFASGIYMYSMSFNNETISKRMVISRK